MKFFSRSVRWSALAILGAFLIMTGCGDTFRPIATPIVSPGGDPGGFDTLTVINCNGTTSRVGPLATCAGTARSNSLTINVSGDSLTASADIGVAPGAVGFDSTRATFYVPNTTSDTITSVAQGSSSTTLTMAPGSNPLVSVVGTTEEYVLDAGSGTVCPNLSIIGIASNAVTNTICTGAAPSFGVQSGANVFILDKVLNQVNVYSPQQGKIVATIAVGTTPVFAVPSFNKNFVYVINQGSNDISIIDANALNVVSTVPSGGSGPMSAFLDRSLVRLYVLNQANSTVTGFNAIGNSTLVTLGTATVGPNPVNLTVLTGGTRAFTANSGNNTLTEINTGSFTTKTITVGQDASALVTDVASSNDGSKLYASTVTAGNFKNGVTVIRTSDSAVVNNLPSPKQDPACVTSTASPCPLQQPQQLIGGH